ncbi:MAG: ABC transporter ATP-binding protein [Candidatus Riflebacteria bacterium HGW-Riflebacteria-1]|nr:MAG: ABC transporter ATP-binding protein [Candidatus Riflebacteria bacterium HGW-Riflebacteria-1]
MVAPIISARGLKKHYQRGIETIKALDGVSLDIRAGEMVSILGPSGSGKTTLINLLSCLDAPDAGELLIAGRSVSGLVEEELVNVRQGVLGFVFQKFHLLPTLTVAENVELPLMFLRRAVDREKTLEILRQVDLENRAGHLPKELSGGQMQRVAIARALITDSKVLIADEPTGNLDKANGEAVFALFRRLVSEKNLAVIVTTHNLALGGLADRIITLEDGLVIDEHLRQ